MGETAIEPLDVSISDAANIGFKIVEMADRVALVDPAVPGTEAKWFFEIDGKRFCVKISLSKLAQPTETSS